MAVLGVVGFSFARTILTRSVLGIAVFAPFDTGTDYWAADKQFMLNLRVHDPEGNAIELWEPPASHC